MQKKKEEFEVLTVKELEEVQGGGDSFFDKIKEVVMSVLGISDVGHNV